MIRCIAKLFKAAVLTLWIFVEYFIAIPELRDQLGGSCPHCPPLAVWLRHCNYKYTFTSHA